MGRTCQNSSSSIIILPSKDCSVCIKSQRLASITFVIFGNRFVVIPIQAI
ncbi:12584_t:CDS:1, partial [Dentiscutata heterogama]